MTDRSSAGEARRVAVGVAHSLGFDEQRRSDIGIVATEAANNVILHAQSGEFLVCPFRRGSAVWLDLLALDRGPGIRDVARAFEDGYSTIGTAGHGLGAIQRLSDACALYSLPQNGTVFWSRFQKSPPPADQLYGVVNIPMKGETACGDAFLAIPGASTSLYMVVDGLGHGAYAAEAAEEAIAVVSAYARESAAAMITRTHDALKKTRGAAMAVAIVEHERKVVTYSGIGNVCSALVNGSTTRNMVSQNGTLGAMLPRVQEYTYPIDERSSLIMYSDGMGSKVGLSSYPGLQNRPPALIAGVLYRDFSRRRDDATVLFASLGGNTP
jgi:anti-sigma regulatory factor (Ser/Thr protein kinase)